MSTAPRASPRAAHRLRPTAGSRSPAGSLPSVGVSLLVKEWWPKAGVRLQALPACALAGSRGGTRLVSHARVAPQRYPSVSLGFGNWVPDAGAPQRGGAAAESPAMTGATLIH